MVPKNEQATTSTPPPGVSVRAYFDKHADYWDGIYSGTGYAEVEMNERRRLVLGLVSEASGAQSLRILDMGCGAGVLSRALFEMGHNVVGLDCSKEMLLRTKRRCRVNHKTGLLGVVRGNASNTPFQDAYFDAIVCVGVIQYQLDDSLLIKEISRLLRPGGFCVFTLPNLLTVAHLTDPIYYLRLLQEIWKRSPVSKSQPTLGSGSFRYVARPIQSKPYNRKFLRWEIAHPVRNYGMSLKKVIGYGCGPLTLMEKCIFSEAFSVRFSRRITRLSRRKVFAWLSYLLNRWVFLVQKPFQ